MPYILPGHRDGIFNGPDACGPRNVGELNYVVTTVVASYLAECGMSYAAMNSVIGVLECAKLELYRRIAAPYESKKLIENGDVYPKELFK